MPQFEKNGFVVDYMFVLQLLDVDEVLPQEEDVFGVQHARLHCQQFPSLLAVTFFYHSMGSLPDFLAHFVHIVEHAGLLSVRLSLTLRIGQFLVENRFEACTFFSKTALLDLVFHGESGFSHDGSHHEGVPLGHHHFAMFRHLGITFHGFNNQILIDQINLYHPL